jgi:peptide/nickel transport system permease protein
VSRRAETPAGANRSSWRIRPVGAGVLLLVTVGAFCAPVLAPNDPNRQFSDRVYAPPTWIRVHSGTGLRAPFIYPQVLEDRLLRRYRDDVTTTLDLHWFSNGRLLSVTGGPLLVLGADSYGRDVFARLLFGARASLGVTALGAIGALLVGGACGGLAGGLGGSIDTLVMLVADYVLVLPIVYLVLVLRAALPIVLPWSTVFLLFAGLFALAGWPRVARGVRAIIASESTQEYALAAKAAGAGPWRLMRHLLPATRGFLSVELVLLVPAMLLAEVTLSFLGLGFPVPAASWGSMLSEVSNVQLMSEAPWLLAPVLALFVVVLGVQLAVGSQAERSEFLNTAGT